MVTINPKWQEKMLRKLEDYSRDPENNPPIDEVTTFSPATKWLIAEAARKGIKLCVTRLGAGVTRLVSWEPCPYCNGTGRNKKGKRK